MSVPESRPTPPAAPEKRPRRARRTPGRPRTVRFLELSHLPRALRNHNSPEGVAYAGYLLPLLRLYNLWPIPDFAVDAARSAGLAMLSLRHLEAELQELQARSGTGRRRKAEYQTEARIRKARVAKRLCEQDLARLAKRAKPQTLAEAIRQRQGRETSA